MKPNSPISDNSITLYWSLTNEKNGKSGDNLIGGETGDTRGVATGDTQGKIFDYTSESQLERMNDIRMNEISKIIQLKTDCPCTQQCWDWNPEKFAVLWFWGGPINEWMAQVHWLGTSWRKCQKCNAIPPRTKSHVYVQVACNVRRHGDTQVNEWTRKRKKFNWNLTTKSSGGFKFWRQIWKIWKNDLEGYTHAYTPTQRPHVEVACSR